MEIAPATDFDFHSSSTRVLYYTSAPSSPTRLTDLYCGFDELLIADCANRIHPLATVPFAWEEKPGVPKTPANLFEEEFSFDVSCHFDSEFVPVQDLFNRGIIKTVDPPRERRERGRDREFSSSRLPNSRSRRTRSLSPLGELHYRREQQPMTAVTNTKEAQSTLNSSSEKGSRKWSFKDLFLFRSHSDGRAMEKDPLKKYSTVVRKQHQDIRSSCEYESVSKTKGRVSAHETHYNMNRANSNEMKRKTYLPYKHGILEDCHSIPN